MAQAYIEGQWPGDAGIVTLQEECIEGRVALFGSRRQGLGHAPHSPTAAHWPQKDDLSSQFGSNLASVAVQRPHERAHCTFMKLGLLLHSPLCAQPMHSLSLSTHDALPPGFSMRRSSAFCIRLNGRAAAAKRVASGFGTSSLTSARPSESQAIAVSVETAEMTMSKAAPVTSDSRPQLILRALGVGGHESPESIDASGSRPNLGPYSRMIPNFV